MLTMLYIAEMDGPPSTLVLLSFATSLTYLGCARSSIVAHCTFFRDGSDAMNAKRLTSCACDVEEVQV